MIQDIIQSIGHKVTDLSFIERYGGLVQTARQIQEVTDGQFTEVAFPVSCNVNASQCWEDGKYQDLVPNDQYSSIAYFEDRNGSQFNGTVKDRPKQSYMQFTHNVRFVCWLNLQKLGITECHAPKAVLQALKALYCKNENIETSSGLKLSRFNMNVTSQLPKDANIIFDRYTYAHCQDALLYPFDYFAFNVQLSYNINPSCFEDWAINTPVNCIEL